MQNRYTADIGDFGKCALLKALAGNDLRVGVVWYLTSDEENPEYGNLLGCLDRTTKFRPIDAELFHALQKLVNEDDRRIAAIRERGILPPTTIFCEDELSFADVPVTVRKEFRRHWIDRVVANTEEAAVVFLDPDIGLACKSARRYGKRGPKHVFPDEVLPYLKRDQSVVVYQHQTRKRGSFEDQVKDKLDFLESYFREKNVEAQRPCALTCHLGLPRAYLPLQETPTDADNTNLFFR